MLSSNHSTQPHQDMTTSQRITSLQRQRASIEEGGEGHWWSITFSDLVLLLLCFVVLWHVADKRRQQHLVPLQKTSVSHDQETQATPAKTAYSHAEPVTEIAQPQLHKQTEPPLEAAIASSLDSPSISQMSTTNPEWQELQSEIHQYIAEQDLDRSVGVISTEQGLVISLSDRITFPSGQATLNAAVTPFLSQVASLASERTTLDIEIAGHTDDRPIATSEFPSNWELSAARASRVARLLLEQERIDPLRVSTRGYAHFRPLYPNDTEEHRAANRRVEIRFFRRVETLGGYGVEW